MYILLSIHQVYKVVGEPSEHLSLSVHFYSENQRTFSLKYSPAYIWKSWSCNPENQLPRDFLGHRHGIWKVEDFSRSFWPESPHSHVEPEVQKFSAVKETTLGSEVWFGANSFRCSFFFPSAGVGFFMERTPFRGSFLNDPCYFSNCCGVPQIVRPLLRREFPVTTTNRQATERVNDIRWRLRWVINLWSRASLQ